MYDNELSGDMVEDAAEIGEDCRNRHQGVWFQFSTAASLDSELTGVTVDGATELYEWVNATNQSGNQLQRFDNNIIVWEHYHHFIMKS